MNDYDQLLTTIRTRRSIRRFLDRAVSREDLAQLFEAARWAPSNHNRQPWKFIVLEDRARVAALAETVRLSLVDKLHALPAMVAAHADEFVHHATVFAQAPVVIVALHRRPASLASALMQGVASAELVSGEPLSVAMAVQNILLAAPTLGLGTCVLTAPLVAREAIAGALTLPPGCEITCLIAVGHPAETPEPPRRKELTHFVDFQNEPR
jgi:coenzyme F420-0:L-glutamate ligase / coenzyme F420-1:gamma-L-glutamate ligase